MLHSHRWLGNIAAHEVEAAHKSELAALEISESMMKTIYIIPKLSQRITTGRP